MPEFVYVVWSPELLDIDMVTLQKEQADLSCENLTRRYPSYTFLVTKKVLKRGLDL